MRKKLIEKPIPNLVIKIVTADKMKDAVSSVPFYVMANVTRSWKRSGCPMEQKALEKFCVDYLKKRTGLEEDFGFIVVVERANERATGLSKKCRYERLGPARFRKEETRKFYVFRNDRKEELKVLDGRTKMRDLVSEAKRMVKSLEFKGERLTCHVEYRLENDNSVFKIERCARKKAKGGKYILFGVASLIQP